MREVDGLHLAPQRREATAREHRHLHSHAPLQKIGEIEMAFAFLGAEIAGREKPAKPSISGTVGRPDDDVRRAVAKNQPASDDITRTGRLGGEMAAHNAGQRVAVGDRKTGEAKH
jgi:hypothetical protein